MITDNPMLVDAAAAAEPADEEQLSLLRGEVKTLKTSQEEQKNTRSMIAWFTETAPNYHQMTIFFMTSPHEQDAEMRKRSPLLFAAGALMLFVQAATAVSIDMGSKKVSCADGSNLACPASQVCSADALRCEWCGGPDWSNATKMHAAHESASWRCSRSALDGGNATLKQCLSSPDIEAAAFNCPTCVVPVECELPAGKTDWSHLPPMGDRGAGWVVNDWGEFGCPSDCFRMSNRHAKGLREPGLENGEGCFRGCDPRTAWKHGLQGRINWCTVCWDASTGTFDTKNGEGREKAFIDGM